MVSSLQLQSIETHAASYPLLITIDIPQRYDSSLYVLQSQTTSVDERFGRISFLLAERPHCPSRRSNRERGDEHSRRGPSPSRRWSRVVSCYPHDDETDRKIDSTSASSTLTMTMSTESNIPSRRRPIMLGYESFRTIAIFLLHNYQRWRQRHETCRPRRRLRPWSTARRDPPAEYTSRGRHWSTRWTLIISMMALGGCLLSG